MAEAELTTVARPYARAAFATALGQPDGLAGWSRMLALLAEALNYSVVSDALDNPRLTMAAESEVLTDLLGDDLSQHGRNFVSVLAENGRLTLLPHIATIYEQLRHQHEQTMNVSITSAFEVEQADLDRLARALHEKLSKDITLSTIVDKSLLGGVIIRADDTVIDDSVRGKLEKLARALN